MPPRIPLDGKPLDLGISALLDEPKGAPLPGDEIPQAAPVPEQSMPAGLGPSEAELLAQRGSWDELANHCEIRLPPQLLPDERFDSLQLRVWWIKSQVERRAVPFSILASPLEDVAESLKAKIAKGDLNGEELQRMQRIAPLLVELLTRFERDLGMHGEESIALHLRTLRSSFEAKGLVPGRVGTNEALSVAAASTLKPAGTPILEMPPSLPRAPEHLAALNQAPLGRTSNLRPLLLIVLLLLVALGYVVFSSNGRGMFGEQATQAGLPLRDGITEPKLIAPALAPVSKVDQLGAILEDFRNNRSPLDDLKSRTAEPAQGSAQTLLDSASAGRGESQEIKQVPAASAAADARNTDRPKDAPKEMIDMSGPIEPRDFPRAEQETRFADRDAGRSVDLRPAQESRPGFEEFNRPKLYRTLVETDVMSSASIRGTALDTLRAGVEVLVEAREGYWLKIRSQKGNVGYILGQDASPVR